MKKFTKLLTLFLSLAMIFSFASCNNGTTSPSDDTVPPTDDTTPPTDDKKPSEDTNTPPSDDKTPSTDTGSGDTEKEEKEEVISALISTNNKISRFRNRSG